VRALRVKKGVEAAIKRHAAGWQGCVAGVTAKIETNPRGTAELGDSRHLGAICDSDKGRFDQLTIVRLRNNEEVTIVAQLNIFIDGSWLFKACAPERALAGQTEWSDKAFQLDFARLDENLLSHAHAAAPSCDRLGSRYLSTSIFSLPDNFDDWPNEYDGVTADDIARTRQGVLARERFVDSAVSVGYSDRAVYRPRMKGWILEKLRSKRYQEKQVDATVVALLVRSAITGPDDVHVVITGDADVLPAIKVAYPEYSKNVFIATTHPDELLAERRQTAFSLSQFDFAIAPYYLQDHTAKILRGEHVYTCAHCHKVFARPKPIPAKARPCCFTCNAKRT